MRVVAFGGYYFSDRAFVYEKLARLELSRPLSQIIRSDHGLCNRLIGEWLRTNTTEDFVVAYEKALEGWRSEQLAFERFFDYRPDGVVIFPGGSECDRLYDRAMRENYKVWDLRYP